MATDDPKRNRSAKKDRDDDPQLRDEDARQPGLNTISSSENDEDNQHLTKTASDSFDEDITAGAKADKRYDE